MSNNAFSAVPTTGDRAVLLEHSNAEQKGFVMRCRIQSLAIILVMALFATTANCASVVEPTTGSAVETKGPVGSAQTMRQWSRQAAETHLDRGQKELQEHMLDLESAWANLPYVSRLEPKEDRGDPTRNKEPGYVCTTTAVNIEKNVQQFPLFAGVAPNVFPGSMVAGRTLETASYGVISGSKAPLKVTANVPWPAEGKPPADPTAEMTEIKHSEYVKALRKILETDISNVSAFYTFELENVYSQDQLKFKLDANVSGSNFDVGAHLKIDQESTRQYALLSLTQNFFRVYVDRPDFAAQFFPAGMSEDEVDDIKRQITETNPPLYVSAMDYGRKLYVLFETNKRSMDIRAELSAGYRGVVEANGEVSTELKQALESISARGFVIGGDPETGGNAVSKFVAGDDALKALTKVRDWIRDGYKPSPANPPAELGFVVSLLLDGSKAAVRSTTEYEERDCDVGVCPSGFFRGFEHNAAWFAVNIQPDPEIAPAAGRIGDTIDIEAGDWYVYNFPLCRGIDWKKVTLECVVNQRADKEEPWSPPGVWKQKEPNWTPYGHNRCHGSYNWQQSNVEVYWIPPGEPPVAMDRAGYPRNPQALWHWQN